MFGFKKNEIHCININLMALKKSLAAFEQCVFWFQVISMKIFYFNILLCPLVIKCSFTIVLLSLFFVFPIRVLLLWLFSVFGKILLDLITRYLICSHLGLFLAKKTCKVDFWLCSFRTRWFHILKLLKIEYSVFRGKKANFTFLKTAFAVFFFPLNC